MEQPGQLVTCPDSGSPLALRKAVRPSERPTVTEWPGAAQRAVYGLSDGSDDGSGTCHDHSIRI